jgi:hypothetical protein
VLPKSINEIMRYKLKAPGMKESDFIVGSRYMMEWMDKEALFPFVPKQNRVY